jgi:hypothetical protein
VPHWQDKVRLLAIITTTFGPQARGENKDKLDLAACTIWADEILNQNNADVTEGSIEATRKSWDKLPAIVLAAFLAKDSVQALHHNQQPGLMHALNHNQQQQQHMGSTVSPLGFLPIPAMYKSGFGGGAAGGASASDGAADVSKLRRSLMRIKQRGDTAASLVRSALKDFKDLTETHALHNTAAEYDDGHLDDCDNAILDYIDSMYGGD